MRIAKDLEADIIDEQKEVMLTVKVYDGEAHTWIDKDEAIRLIAHLQEQFGI